MRHRKDPDAFVNNGVLHGVRKALDAETADATANQGRSFGVAQSLGHGTFNRRDERLAQRGAFYSVVSSSRIELGCGLLVEGA